MPIFPRAAYALPRLATPPRFAAALQSWGLSGKGQMRATGTLGRVWEETYPILDTARPSVRALIAAINQSLREGTLWDVQHPYWQQRLGDPGAPGTPLVNGAGQTGATLNIDGFWTNSCTAPINIDQSPWVTAGTAPTMTPAASIAPDGTLTAVRLQDASAAALARREFSATVVNNSANHLVGAYVRKRALGGVYAAVGAYLSGGTVVERYLVLNPETGTFVTTAGTVASGVVDIDANWWFVWLVIANNTTGNTTLLARVVPAFNTDGTTTATIAAQGTTDFWGVRIQLNVATPTLPVLPWLYAGEVIKVAGAPVLLDVATSVVLLGATHAVNIHPPLFAGQSPADNAVITTDPTQFYFSAHLVDVGDFPEMDTTRFIDAGLTLTWQEQPL